MSLFSKFRSAINKLQRKAINKTYQKRLTNQGMSVISANCVGAFILHDLNLENKLIVYILYIFLRYSNVFAYECEEKTKVRSISLIFL